MKHSKFRKKQSDKKQNNIAPDQRLLPVILMWSVPLILSIPAVALSIMGHYSWAASLTQVLLPMGVMLVLLSVWRRVGITTLCLLPFMVLAAFQIVLLFLYADGSIIGVDMFLNVVTTNSSEALELLGNLLPAIALCIALYLPVLIIAIMITRRGWGVNSPRRRMAAFVGCLIAAVGTLALATSLSSERSYKIDEDLYPVNVCNNMAEAFKRSYRTKNYYRDSADFSFGVSSERPDSIREVYIAVIGETSRADNWQLFGYDRFTTPYLCSMPDSALAAYAHTLSESNTTHKAVPLLLSTLTSDNFGKQINRTKSVVSAFKEAGYATDFISMQARNRSYIDFFAYEADSTVFLREPEPGIVNHDVSDIDALPLVDSILRSGHGKQLIVIHLYGSHFNYFDRYPREQAYFLPDHYEAASQAQRGRLMNAYDNSIRQTDHLLVELINRLDSIGCPGGLIFSSDHGEDIFDDERGRFLHASPTPTFHQLHVPFIVYMTPALRSSNPGLWMAAKANEVHPVSSSASYTPTLLSMAGLLTEKADSTKALTTINYSAPEEFKFLNDLNRAESLQDAGFTSRDFTLLSTL